MFNDNDDMFLLPKSENIKEIINNLNTKNIYSRLSKTLEYGGILCGNQVGNVATVDKIIYIPSLTPLNNAYHFDKNFLLNNANMYCGNKEYIGTWHSHPSQETYPSEQDRRVSHNMKKIGCILTDKLFCYNGWKNIHVKNLNK